MENGRFLSAPLAQRIRASDYGSEGRGFKSLRARHHLAPRTEQINALASEFGLSQLARLLNRAGPGLIELVKIRCARRIKPNR
jgi:hypothetical protein